MTACWQRVGCLLVVLYASLTSLFAVSSGKTTGYVGVITADTEAADWPYWMRMTVLESKQWTPAGTKYTPKVPYGSSFTATLAAKSSPLAPDVPTLLLTSSWERCDPLYSVAHWGNDLKSAFPGH